MGGTALAGSGYKLLGCRRIGPDGSYVATQFFCILYVPLVPIKTLRVTPAPGQSRMPFVPKKLVRAVKQPLDLSQVFAIYLATFIAIGYGLCFFEFAVPYLRRHANLTSGGFLEFLFFLVWMALPWYVIQSAGKRAMERASEDIRKLNTAKPIGR